MKLLALLPGCLWFVAAALGANWPPVFLQAEAEAFRHPAGLCAEQLPHYAAEVTRTGELRQRWEEKAQGADAWRYEALLGQLAKFRQDPNGARERFHKATELAPESAEAWLLRGALETNEQTAEARPALEKALALSSTEHDRIRAITSLVYDHQRNGRKEEAFALLMRHLTQAPTLKGAPLTREAVGFAVGQDGVGELLAALEKAQQEGLDSGANLAFAYWALDDQTMAGHILEEARRAHPEDAGLVAAALEIGRGNSHPMTRVTLLREQMRLAPSALVVADLFAELARAGVAEDVEALLAQHPRELAATAMRWRVCLADLFKLDLSGAVRTMLAQAPESWETSFVRAELFILDRDYIQAAAALWPLLAASAESQPFTSTLRPPGGTALELAPSSTMLKESLNSRLRRVRSNQEEWGSIFQQQPGRVYVPWGNPSTLEQVRERALILLMKIAEETKQQAVFMEQFTKSVAGLPAEERVFLASLTDRPALVVAAVESWAAQPEHTFWEDQYCRSQLALVPTQANVPAEVAARSAGLLQRLPVIMAPPSEVQVSASGLLPKPELDRLLRLLRQRFGMPFEDLRGEGWPLSDDQWRNVINAHGDLFKLTAQYNMAVRSPPGPPESQPVLSLQSNAWNPNREDDPAHPLSAPEMAWQADRAFQRGDFGQALASFRLALERAQPVGRRGGYREWFRPSQMARSINPANPPAEAIATVVQCLATSLRSNGLSYHWDQALWPSQPPMNYGSGFDGGFDRMSPNFDLTDATKQKLVYPPSSLLDPEGLGLLWSLQPRLREAKAWLAVKTRLTEAWPALPAAEARSLRMMLCYLQWWKGEPAEGEKVMRELLAETGEDRYRLALAAMARQTGQGKEAVQLLQQMRLPYPAFRRQVAMWQLRIACEAHDAAAVTTLTAELAQAPLAKGDLAQLAGGLRAAGYLAEEAPLRARLALAEKATRQPHNRADELNDLLESGDKAGAARLARQILAETYRAAQRRPEIADLRRSAFGALSRLGEWEAYLAELQKTAAEHPTAEAYLRVGEAAQDPEILLQAYTEVFRLDPGNLVAARALLKNVLQKEGPEQIPWFEAVLKDNADEALMYQRQVINQYFTTKQYARLVEQLSAAPIRLSKDEYQRSRTEEMLLGLVNSLRKVPAAEPAAALLKMTQSLMGLPPSRQMRGHLLAQMTALGPAGLRPEAVDLIMPVPPAVAPAPFSVLSNKRREQAPIFDLGSLRIAHQAGLSDALIARTAQLTAAYPEARRIALFLRVLKREPAVLVEIGAIAAQPKFERGEVEGLSTLLPELAEWPAASQVCLQVLTIYKGTQPTSPPGYAQGLLPLANIALKGGHANFAADIVREMIKDAREPRNNANLGALITAFELAITLREPALMRECGGLLGVQVAKSDDRNKWPLEQARRLTGLLLDARRFEEAAALLQTLTANKAVIEEEERGSLLPESAFALQAELALQRGEVVNLTPLAWVETKLSTPERAAIVWDLGLGKPSKYPADAPPPNPALLYGDVPEAPAEATDWDVELRFGETAQESRVIARLHHVGPRGLWRGAWPAKAGYWSAVLIHEQQRWEGPATAFVFGPNLFRALPAGGQVPHPPVFQEGRPAWEESCLSFPAREVRAEAITPIGQPVKVVRGREYEFSGWVHAAGQDTMAITLRFLDENRKPIFRQGERRPETYQARVYFHFNLDPRRWWHYGSIRIGPAARVSSIGIPPDAVYLEPVVITSGQAGDAAGISLILVPQPKE